MPTRGRLGARGINYWESSRSLGSPAAVSCNAATSPPSTRRPARRFTSFGDERARGSARWRSVGATRAIRCRLSNPGRIFENLIIISLPAQGAGYDVDARRRAGV